MSSFLRCARLAACTGQQLLKSVKPSIYANVQKQRAFSISALRLGDRKYTEGHEWVMLSGSVGRVGLSDHAQDALGDIVFVELPEEGASFEQNEECGVVESVKAVSEIFAPISGTIVKRNTDVVDEPALINKSCYDNGWLFEIELSNLKEMDGLMDEDAYTTFLESQ